MPRQPILSVLGHVDSGKCVAPHTEISLSDGRTITAKSLFERFEQNGEAVNNNEGEVYSLETPPKVFGLDHNQIKECEATHAWKLEKDKLLKFKLKDGSEIEVTPEHPFLSVKNSELTFSDAEAFSEGDFVAIPEYMPVEDQNLDSLKSLTLSQLSRNTRLLAFVEDEFSSMLYEEGKHIEAELLNNHLSSCKHCSRYRVTDIVEICDKADIPLDEAYDFIIEIKQATLKQRTGSTSKRITLPSTLSEFEEFGYLTGLMMGDGNRDASKLFNNSEILLEEFSTAVENSLSSSVTIKEFDNQVDEAFVQVGKTLHVVLETLFDYPKTKKSHSITLSNYALQLPRPILGSIISGYFDADGYVSKKGTIEITSASKKMIKRLKTALKQFGISANIKTEDNYPTLYITGKDNLERFAKIGFRNPRKKERFKRHCIKAQKNPITGQTPVSGEEIRQVRLEVGANHTEIEIPYQKKYESHDNVSKQYLNNFLNKLEELRESSSFKKNIEEKKQILDLLTEEPKSRSRVYEENSISHRRLLNHILSLESENLIQKQDDDKLYITEKGLKLRQKWGEKTDLNNLKKIANSGLKFVKVQKIKEIEGGTVYDFTTELETFVAEDILVHNTTLLDNIRESKIVEGEAGGITQMIGATEIPLDTVEGVCGGLLQQLDTDLTIPGLLFIDTPGHAAFSSLRKRGGSISDIAILVIDIEEGVQPQTEEAIKILKQSQTPFVIALNKVDKMPGWKSEDECFSKNLQHQSDKNIQKLDEEIYELMAELNEYGFVIDRFDRVDNFTEKIGVIPISAMTGEGLPELLMVVSGLAQNYLSDKLEVKEGVGKATVLEVSEQKGFGTTVDVIHYDGTLKKSDKLVYGTAEGPEVTDIRALLKPRPLKEIRLDKQYEEVEEVHPASGIKIAGKDLDGAVSGAPIRTGSNVEELKQEVQEELETTEYETQTSGVIVKADSLGSLEALMREIQDMDLNVQKAEVGLIKKSDIIEVENEDPEERAVLSFNAGATENAEALAEDKGIQVFSSNVIYEILEGYTTWKNDMQEGLREKALEKVSRPAEIRTLQDHVFRSSNPVVVGMKVVDGVINHGSLMTEDGEKIGRIKSIQDDGESLDKAEKGDMVALSIANATLDRDFEAGDHLYVDINSKDYKRLKELDDLLSAGEKKTLEKIVDIKDSVNPHWKLG